MISKAVSAVPTSARPLSNLEFEGLGVVRYDDKGEIGEVVTQYGGRRANPWLDNPWPNATYHVSPSSKQVAAGASFLHMYRTDRQGLTEEVWVDQIQRFSGDQKGKRRSRKPMAEPRGGSWDRGHLIASEFGGGMELINLVWMARPTNQGLSAASAHNQGHHEVASLLDRFDDPASLLGGTLDTKGEWKVPKYRAVERGVGALIDLAEPRPEWIGVRVTPERNGSAVDRLFYRVWIAYPDGVHSSVTTCVVAHF